MAKQLKHSQIRDVINSLSEAKIVNLDASIKTLIDPIAKVLSKTGVSDEVAIHVLCCNEYALVTGLMDNTVDVNSIADSVRASLGQVKK